MLIGRAIIQKCNLVQTARQAFSHELSLVVTHTETVQQVWSRNRWNMDRELYRTDY